MSAYKIFHIKHITHIKSIIFSLLVLIFFAGLMPSPEASNPQTALTSATSSQDNSKREKTIFLTFDDGPSQNTAHLLDVLEKHNIKASFFLIGPVESIKSDYDFLISRMAKLGHTIAPHSYSHDYAKIYSSKENFMADYHKISSTLCTITGSPCSLYRFPGGSLNRNVPPHVRDEIIKALSAENIVFYDWNVVSGDDTATVFSPQILCENVLTAACKFDTAVVLFHDAALCQTTADAVDILVPALKNKGYKFSAITPETNPIQFYH